MADKAKQLEDISLALTGREHMIWQTYQSLLRRPGTIYAESLEVAANATDHFLNRIKFMEPADDE